MSVRGYVWPLRNLNPLYCNFLNLSVSVFNAALPALPARHRLLPGPRGQEGLDLRLEKGPELLKHVPLLKGNESGSGVISRSGTAQYLANAPFLHVPIPPLTPPLLQKLDSPL